MFPNNPSVTFIVVGKRYHTQFFPLKFTNTWVPKPKPRDAIEVDDGTFVNGNIKAGLLIEDIITRHKDAGYPDFFLLSQEGIEKTSRPAHHVII